MLNNISSTAIPVQILRLSNQHPPIYAMMLVYPAQKVSFASFLSKYFSTLSIRSGTISTTRSNVDTGGTATGSTRVMPSRITKNATGSILTPAALPPPKSFQS